MSGKTYDANRHRKSYPFMRKRPVILNTGSSQAEIDIETAKLVFNNEYTKTYNFDGSNLPSGIYFYELQVNGNRSNKKMLLIK